MFVRLLLCNMSTNQQLPLPLQQNHDPTHVIRCPEAKFGMTWMVHATQAILLISSSSSLKDKAAKEAAFRVLACAALQYKQLDHLLAVLTDMLNKNEHMSVICAELAEYAAQHFGDNQLVSSLVAKCSPECLACNYNFSICTGPCRHAAVAILPFSSSQLAWIFCAQTVLTQTVCLSAWVKSIL